jgi:hypothetical protein
MKLEGDRLRALTDFLGAVAEVVEQKATRVTLRRLRALGLAVLDGKNSDGGGGGDAGGAGGGGGGGVSFLTTDAWDAALSDLKVAAGMEAGGGKPVMLSAHLSEIGGIDDLPWQTCAGENHQ